MSEGTQIRQQKVSPWKRNIQPTINCQVLDRQVLSPRTEIYSMVTVVMIYADVFYYTFEIR